MNLYHQPEFQQPITDADNKGTIMKRLMIILSVLLLSGVAMGVVQYRIPYGVASTVYFPLYDSNSPWNLYGTAPATADVNVVEDLEDPASATNAVVDNNGVMAWTISATEATSKTIQLLIQDASAPPLYMDQVVILTTYGHATAAFDQPTTAAGTFNDLATSSEAAELNQEKMDANSVSLAAILVDTGTTLPSSITAIPELVWEDPNASSPTNTAELVWEDANAITVASIAAIPELVWEDANAISPTNTAELVWEDANAVTVASIAAIPELIWEDPNAISPTNTAELVWEDANAITVASIAAIPELVWEDPNAGLMAAAVESGNKLILFGQDANGLTEDDSVTMDPNTLTTSDNPRWSIGWLLRKIFGGI